MGISSSGSGAWLYNVDISYGPGNGVDIEGSSAEISASSLSYNYVTGIWVGADSANINSNTLQYNGTAGVSVNSTNAQVVGNSFFSNRMLAGGGQLWLSGTVSGAILRNNTIDGNNYYNSGTAVLGCSVDVSHGAIYSGGIEGENPTATSLAPAYLENNESKNHYGDGMSFYGSSYIQIEGKASSGTQYNIHDNGGVGIKFWNPPPGVANVGVQLEPNSGKEQHWRGRLP